MKVRKEVVIPKDAKPVIAGQTDTNTVVTQAKVSVEDPFKNGKADAFALKDAELNGLLTELRGDAATLANVPQSVDGLATIFGTARSKPVPGENGYADYVWSIGLGAELRLEGYSVSTGAGPGGMEAPMVGHTQMDATLDMKAGRTVGWSAGEPGTEGANIILPHEQGANKFIKPDHLKSFKRFLFRMEFLFRDNAQVATDPGQRATMRKLETASRQARETFDLAKTPEQKQKALQNLDVVVKQISEFIKTYEPHNSPKIASPGGFGTVAEVFTYVAMKSHKQASEPVVYGSHDDFFKRHNEAFAPFMNEWELPDLANVYTDQKALVQAIKLMPPTENPIDAASVMPRMMDDLEKGLSRLDGKPKAIAFFGGAGARTKAVAGQMEEIAAKLSSQGATIRVGGSPIADEAVLRGVAKSSHPEAEIQAFAMADAPVESHGKLDYTKITDVLVLRELMDTNVGGMVVSPEGAKQIALMFTAACDVQTGKMPHMPIVVLDPDGKFEALKKEIAEIMLSPERKYISPEDMNIVRTARTVEEAMAILNEPPPAPPAAH